MRRFFLFTLACAVVGGCDAIIGLHGEPQLLGGDASPGGDGGGDAGSEGGPAVPVLLASQQGGPFFITEFGAQVFWTDWLGGTIGFADKVDGSGGIFASALDSPFGIGADDSGVYFASSGLSGTVNFCPFAGCGANTALYSAGFTNTDLLLLHNEVYWLQADNDEIDRMTETGSGFQKLTATDTNNNAHYLARIATDGTTVFWTETANDKVLSHTIGMPTTKTLFTLPSGSGPSAIRWDSGVLYFATFGAANGQGSVFSANPDGSSAPTALAASQRDPYAIATDATYVYWTTEGDFPDDGGAVPLPNGGVYRCAKTGCNGTPDQLAGNLVDARGIVVDDTAIYFVTFETGNSDGKVWRLAK